MRIYGGRDYYDNVVAWGQDPKTVLVRSHNLFFPATEVPLDVPTLEVRLEGNGDYITTQWIVVVLCDKVYRGLRVSLRGTDHFFWNVEKLQTWADENRFKISVHRRWFYASGDARSGVTLMNCMDVMPISAKLREFLLKHRLAILLDLRSEYTRDSRPLLANPPNLKQFGFAKAVDPYTVFQELSMWISGVLGGQSPETVYITDDKVILEGHGFDKHSFRSSERT